MHKILIGNDLETNVVLAKIAFRFVRTFRGFFNRKGPQAVRAGDGNYA